MAAVNIYSASPLSSASSEESQADNKANFLSQSTDTTQSGTNIASESMMEVPIVSKSNSDAVGQSAESSGNRVVADTAQPMATSDRSVPRINTNTSSVTANSSLPWKIDDTSAPLTTATNRRRATFVPPPRTDYHQSVNHGKVLSPPPASYSTPYQSSASNNRSRRPNSHNRSHTVDFSHPPNYMQNTRNSLSDTLPSAGAYSNSTPFYQNNQSCSSSISSPMTPSRRGRGILDNDPDIYLRGEGDGDEESMWDTAAKWARAAGKRLSAGEQTLWRMVNAVANGEGDR